MPHKSDKIHSLGSRAWISMTSDKIYSPLYMKDLRSHGILTLENMFAFSIISRSFILSDFYHCVSIE